MDQDTTGKSGSRSWRDRLGIDEQKPSGSDSTPARAEPAPRPSTPPQAKPAAPKVQAKVVANPAPMAPRPGTAAKAPPAPKPAPAPQRAAQDDAFAERLRKHREAAEEAVKKRSGSASLEKFSFAKKEVEVAKAEKSPPATAPAPTAPAPAPTASAPAPPPAAAAPWHRQLRQHSVLQRLYLRRLPQRPYLRPGPWQHLPPRRARRVFRHNGQDHRHRSLHNPHTGRSSPATLVLNSLRLTVRPVRDMLRLPGRTWHHREVTRRVVSPVMGRQPLRHRARLRHLHKAISARHTATMICFRTMAIVRLHRLAGPHRNRPRPSRAMTCAPGLTIRSMTLLPAGMAAGLHAITRKPIASSTTTMKTMNQGADGAA
jgi:hypothetical protein